MKPFLLILLIAFGSLAHSQVDSSVAFSRMEKWLREPGTLIRTEETSLGYLNNVNVGVITATDLDHDVPKRKVICFSYQPLLLRANISLDNTHVDEEEFATLINILERMSAVLETNGEKKLQILSYTTSNLVVFEFRNRPGNLRRWDLSIYKRYIHINTPVAGSQVRIDQEDIPKLIQFFKNHSQK